MWLYSKDSSSNFPYSHSSESEVKLLNGWVLYNSLNKKGEAFSTFVHDLINIDNTSKISVQNALKKIKTLKHPDMINFVDANESTKEIQIITEKVEPLEKYLKEKSDSGNFPFIASWGLFQILRGLTFLNSTCKCQHNQIRLSSVFVNKSGDWKLGCFDYVTTLNDSLPSIMQSDLYWPTDKNKIDSYGYGCLIWETFNRYLSKKTDLKDSSKIPGQLVKNFQKFIHPKSNIRPNLENALKELSGPGGYFDNFYVKTLLFLEEIQIKEQEEKDRFMKSLTDLVDNFPDDIAKYKILPHLLTCHQFGGAGIEVLLPLVKLGKLLDQSEFETSVVPRLVAMFHSNNRSTRVRLLEQLPSFIDILPYKIVDQDIFPAVVKGLSDTNPIVREATIRSVVHLAPKLGQKSLNDVLVSHLMNLQLKDEQGGIRTNATVCLAKIAHLLSTQVRQTSLLNVMLKCTRDPFVPAKLSAVSALAASQHLFLLDDVATKLLPCLSFLTIDPEKEVREQTFKAIEFALSRLKEVSQNPELNKMASVENKEAQSYISWKNWAVNLIKKTDTQSTLTTRVLDSHTNGSGVPSVGARDDNPATVTPSETKSHSSNQGMEKHRGFTDDDDDDDEEEEWGALEEMTGVTKTNPVVVATNKIDNQWAADNNEDVDDFFDRLIREESAGPKKANSLQLNKKNGANKQPEIIKTSKQPAVVKTSKQPAVVKTSVSATSDDGWGDVDW